MKIWKELFSIVLITWAVIGCASPSLAQISGEKHGKPLLAAAQTEFERYEPNLIMAFREDLADYQNATRYRIVVDIGEDMSSVIGSQEVHYTNTEKTPLDEIYFRLFPNVSADNMMVESVRADGLNVNFALEFENTAVKVELLEALDPGEAVNLSLDFSQSVPSVMGGNYGLYVYVDEILALDSFFPIIPVFNDEGWNVEDPPLNADMIFTDASFFEVQVSAPQDLVIVASGVEVESAQKSGRQMITFVAGPQRDFYLAASPRFVSESLQVNGTRVTSYYPPEVEKMGNLVLNTAAKALEIYSKRFGEYPYMELDLVSTPMQAGGMEYSGAAAMALFLYDSGATISGVPGSIFLESATAHEVAHQWFFNQVMNDQIDEPWLDEGLAQYLTYIYYLDTYRLSTSAAYRASWDARWERLDDEKIPIGKPAAEYEREEYSPIIYGRAPIFIQELEKEMGSETFANFLKDYVETYRWQIVNTRDFKSLAEQSCACDLGPIFREWGAIQ